MLFHFYNLNELGYFENTFLKRSVVSKSDIKYFIWNIVSWKLTYICTKNGLLRQVMNLTTIEMV